MSNTFPGFGTDMVRAYGSRFGFLIYYNGLKPVATKCFEPTALLYFKLKHSATLDRNTKVRNNETICGSNLQEQPEA